MSDFSITRLGQANATGDVRETFLKVFTGEVITAFDQATKFINHARVRDITSGKSASFANTGRAVGRYHTPGTEIDGQTIRQNERIITIDDLLIADVSIANIDEAMNHYQVRGEFTKQLGLALARTYDKQHARAHILAARAASNITGLPGGTVITLSGGYAAASAAAKAAELAAAIFTAHQTLVEKDVDLTGVRCFVKPATYFMLVQFKDLLNKDWGGVGSYAMGSLPMIAGIPLDVTNFLPTQDDAANTTGGVTTDGGDVIHSKYAGDFSKTVAVVSTPDAIGTVNLMGLAVEDEYSVRHQATLIVAKKLSGSGILNPPCAVEIKLP